MTSTNDTSETNAGPLEQAVVAASLAPSIFNTQPWRWHVAGDTAELHRDRSRQLKVVDPDGRLMTVSCGGALHHALVALTAAGHIVTVDRMPEKNDTDLLAVIHVTGTDQAEPEAMRQYQSLLTRHTDRRPFADELVPETSLAYLQKAAETSGAHLQLLRSDQLATFISAVSRAERAEMADPTYRAELAAWTGRAADATDGVPANTAVPPTPRRVPVREFTVDGHGAQPDATPADMYARYALLATNGDAPEDWLTAGEALSAVLIAAVTEDLAISPMSDVTEVLASREQLRGLLSGIGYPQIALRIGITDQPEPAPATSRRTAKNITDPGSRRD